MRTCPLCKEREIEDWESLCSDCWNLAIQARRIKQIGNGELVEKLKGKAKVDLFELMRELCKQCEKFSEDVSDEACNRCVWKEKEKLIRAFLE